MELRELKSFVTAAKFRSISKAATDLGLGQPTVTTHIKKLEKELNMVLFDRVTRPIRLTLSGQTIFDLSQPLLDGLDSLAVRTSEAEERGPVTVASTPFMVSIFKHLVAVCLKHNGVPIGGNATALPRYDNELNLRHMHEAFKESSIQIKTFLFRALAEISKSGGS